MKKIKFSEFIVNEKGLEEMSIAGYGNWVPNKSLVSTKSAHVVETKWILLGEIKADKSNEIFSIYKSPSGKAYICGDFVETSTGDRLFEIVFSIKLTEQKSIASVFKLSKLMNVDGVEVKEDLQGDGIALAVYKFLVLKEKITILGDEIQYFGARKLWVRISKHTDVIVDIIDIEKDIVLERNVLLHHGTDDWDFDNRVWSYDTDKKDIRLILTKVV